MKDKIYLYITSLWLLFFLLIILKINFPICFTNYQFIGFNELFKKNIISAVSIIFLVFGLVYCASFNYRVQGTCQTQVKIKNIKNINYKHLTFLTTYIIPLICFDLSKIRYSIILFVLLFIIGIIYVKTELFYANPTLALLGYHIYIIDGVYYVEKKRNEKNSIIVITKEIIKINEEIKLMKLDNNIFYGGKA